MWLITERGIRAFLILLSSLGHGSVLTHNTACHHPATLHLRWHRVTCDPSITSRTRVQAYQKIKSILLLQHCHRDRRCRQDDKESKNECDSVVTCEPWGTHTARSAHAAFLLALRSGESGSPPCKHTSSYIS